jgi:hypothetical protein
MCNTPVEVQFTSAGCLNYPCRTPDALALCAPAFCAGKTAMAARSAADTAFHPHFCADAPRENDKRPIAAATAKIELLNITPPARIRV